MDNWVQCDECHSWMHWTCGLYKGEDTSEDCLFFCDNCRLTRGKALAAELTVPPAADLSEDKLSASLQARLLGLVAGPPTLPDAPPSILCCAGVPAQGAVRTRSRVGTRHD